MASSVLNNVAGLLWGGWRRRYLIVIPALILPIVGGVVGVIAPKKYATSTTILIQETSRQNPFLEDLSVSTNLKERMPALNALLHSRHILTEVAYKMKMIEKETPEADKQYIIGKLSASLTASLVGEELIEIKYTSSEPEKMAEVLKLVSLRFVERVIAPQRSSIFQSEAFLAKELEQRGKDLAEAERKLAEYKSKYASELPKLHASNVSSLGRLRENLAELKTRYDGAQAARDQMKERISQTNPVVGRIEEAIVDVLSELATLRARYTEKHTKIQGALRRLKSLEEERAKALAAAKNLDASDIERLWNIASTRPAGGEDSSQPLLISQLERLQEADEKVQSLQNEIKSMEEQLEILNTRVTGFGEHERRLGELQRDIEVSRKIYEELAERHQKARVTGALGRAEESERVKLIDAPYTPTAPLNLPVVVFIIGGLVGGFGLGCGLAVFAEVLDTTVRRRDALSKVLDVPVFARIPPLPNEGFEGDADSLDPDLLRLGSQ